MDKQASSGGLGTRAVWAGERGERWQGATQVPVALSVSFAYPTVEDWLEVALGKRSGHIYGRNTNPTVAAFEEKVRDLEGAEAATSFASGMAALSRRSRGLDQRHVWRNEQNLHRVPASLPG
jgi:cystathionine gamma-synthase